MKARVKTVFPTDEIPHRWWHSLEGFARNPQNNLYYDGQTIFSYGQHFPLAHKMRVTAQGQDGSETIVLLNCTERSVTTRRHSNMVNRAIPDGTPIFRLPLEYALREIGTIDISPRLLNKFLTTYETRLHKQAGLYLRARQHKGWRLERYRDTLEEANRFCSFFSPAHSFELLENLPKNSKELDDMLKKHIEDRQSRDILLASVRAKREAANIRSWCAGETAVFPHSIQKVYLRVIEDAESKRTLVQTSLGARVGIRSAAALLAVIRECREKGISYNRDTGGYFNGHQQIWKVGEYVVDKIDSEGNLVAGCHRIAWEQIEAVAPDVDAAREALAQASTTNRTESEENQ